MAAGARFPYEVGVGRDAVGSAGRVMTLSVAPRLTLAAAPDRA